MLADWKTWLGLAFALAPIVLRVVPFTAPIVAGMLQTKIGRLFMILLLVFGGLFFGAAWFEDRGFDRGVQKTEERIEQRNDDAISRARNAARSVDECYDREGDWDQSTGRCSK